MNLKCLVTKRGLRHLIWESSTIQVLIWNASLLREDWDREFALPGLFQKYIWNASLLREDWDISQSEARLVKKIFYLKCLVTKRGLRQYSAPGWLAKWYPWIWNASLLREDWDPDSSTGTIPKACIWNASLLREDWDSPSGVNRSVSLDSYLKCLVTKRGLRLLNCCLCLSAWVFIWNASLLREDWDQLSPYLSQTANAADLKCLVTKRGLRQTVGPVSACGESICIWNASLLREDWDDTALIYNLVSVISDLKCLVTKRGLRLTGMPKRGSVKSLQIWNASLLREDWDNIYTALLSRICFFQSEMPRY